MLLMCTQAAKRGGATTFTKSDIFVVPKRGSATFFSYKGDDGRMDDGFTEHSGCPVIEGGPSMSICILQNLTGYVRLLLFR